MQSNKILQIFHKILQNQSTKFKQKAFRFNISIIHCVRVTFFRTQCSSIIMLTDNYLAVVQMVKSNNKHSAH